MKLKDKSACTNTECKVKIDALIVVLALVAFSLVFDWGTFDRAYMVMLRVKNLTIFVIKCLYFWST